ncbi:hypothetical protein DPX16_3918 [Anabarilius grahami]|uniref:Uncharacterized protein n=1 Tax=Anabarilius grahami TaxID=495550 RepID=A0A3N0XM20_ANAGA|nr:hypothetical protein DPX16_3918 [Anabarilius grahami]
MGKHKDLSEFDKDKIVMARRLDQSISKTAALVGCSRSAVVSIYQKWFKEGTVVNRQPRLIDPRGERRLACSIFQFQTICKSSVVYKTFNAEMPGANKHSCTTLLLPRQNKLHPLFP